MSKKNKKNFICHCGETFKTEKELIKHYRKKHPNDAIQLYERIGITGDKFSDKFIKILINENNEHKNSINKLCSINEYSEKEYAKLVFNYNQLVNVTTSIKVALTNAEEAIKKE